MLDSPMRFVLLLTLLSFNLSASKYESKDWFFRSQLGQAVYFASEYTTLIDHNLLTGFEFENLLSDRWSLGVGVKPLFARNRFVLGLAGTAKYRFLSDSIPVIPFVSVGLSPSVLLATEWFFTAHFNLGLRAAAGIEYFIAPNLGLSLEAGLTPSLVWGKGVTRGFESTADILVGLSWRLGSNI